MVKKYPIPAAEIPTPIIRLTSSDSSISLISSSHLYTHDLSTGELIYSSCSKTPHDPLEPTKAVKDLKGKAIRFLASGWVPIGKPLGGVQDVEEVVAVVGEDRVLKLVHAETGKVFYERNLIKKAAYISVEDDGTVLVTDKNGDVFAYPFVDDSLEASGVPKSTAPRPDATALQGDPSLNPDAKLLLGHVSVNTAHLVTPDKKYIITADRDEHIRVSRYPDAYVIDKYLFGHETFVSAICIPPTHPNLLLSAGGSPDLFIHDYRTSQLLQRIPILPTLKPYRTIRSAMRRAPKRIQLALKAEEERLIAEGKGEEVEKMRKDREESEAGRGKKVGEVAEEEWMVPVRGWWLPDGEGICVGKIEVVGKSVVLFSEGCRSIHSLPLDSVIQPPFNTSTIQTLSFPFPVLDFCPLPSSDASKPNLLLVSTDPSWKYRIDGGKAFFPNANDGWFRKGPKGKGKDKDKDKGKGKGKQEEGKKPAEGEGTGDVDMDMDMEEALNDEVAPVKEEEEKKIEGYTEEEIDEMCQSALRMVRVKDDNTLEDVSEEYEEYLSHFETPTGPVQQVLDIQLYQDLTFYPKWQSEEDEEELNDYSVPEPTADNPSAGKRTIGRLRAQGVDVQDLLQKQKHQKWQLKQQAKEKNRKDKGDVAAAVSAAGEGSGKRGAKGKKEKKGGGTKGNGKAVPIPAAASEDVEMGEPDLEAAMNG